MEIQADAAAAAGKVQAQHEANMMKMLDVQTDAQIEREKMMLEAQSRAAELALRNRELQGREAMEAARMTHMVARDTAGLV